jgi:hypothetical protein
MCKVRQLASIPQTKTLLLLAFLLCGVRWAEAQSLKPSFEIGLLGGLAFYNGDLGPEAFGDHFQEIQPAVGVFGRYTFNPYFAARLGFTYAIVSGDDEYSARPERDLSFRAPLFELALTGEFSPFVFGTPYETPLFAPYLTAGIGLFNFRPETRFEGEWVELQPLGTEAQGLPGYPEKYSRTQLNIPLGVGLRVVLNDTWTVGVEFVGRKLFTDHLDDVSDAEVNYRDLIQGNGVLAAQLSNKQIDPSATDDFDFTYRRGGPAEDWYYTAALSVTYRLWQGSGKGGGKFPSGPVCPGF